MENDFLTDEEFEAGKTTFVFGDDTIELYNGKTKEYIRFMEKYREDHKFCPNCGVGVYATITHTQHTFNQSNPDGYKDLNDCVCCFCKDKHTIHDRVAISNNLFKTMLLNL